MIPRYPSTSPHLTKTDDDPGCCGELCPLHDLVSGFFINDAACGNGIRAGGVSRPPHEWFLHGNGRTGCDVPSNSRPGHIRSSLYHVANHDRGKQHTPFALEAPELNRRLTSDDRQGIRADNDMATSPRMRV